MDLKLVGSFTKSASVFAKPYKGTVTYCLTLTETDGTEKTREVGRQSSYLYSIDATKSGRGTTKKPGLDALAESILEAREDGYIPFFNRVPRSEELAYKKAQAKDILAVKPRELTLREHCALMEKFGVEAKLAA